MGFLQGPGDFRLIKKAILFFQKTGTEDLILIIAPAHELSGLKNQGNPARQFAIFPSEGDPLRKEINPVANLLMRKLDLEVPLGASLGSGTEDLIALSRFREFSAQSTTSGCMRSTVQFKRT